MPYPKRLLRFILLILLVCVSPLHADDGEEIFREKCSGCHTVGGGDTAGPDLKGVAGRRDREWLIRVIVEPDALTREKDPTHTALVKKYGMQMPSLGVSREEAAKIVAFLGGAPGAAAPAEKKEEAAASPGQAAQGEEIFQEKCSGCHTVGGGDTAGPDLKGVAGRRDREWLIRVIVEPEAFKDETRTALAKKYGMEMPNVDADREEAAKIIAFLGGAPAAAAPGEKKTAAAVTPELVARGKALYTGASPFAKGGLPCGACHRLDHRGIAGGTLAGNLSGLYGRLGEAGLSAVLSSLRFPVMKEAYADRPLTDEERGALLALWKDEATAGPPAGQAGAPAAKPTGEAEAGGTFFPLAGFGIFILFVLGFALYNRRDR